VGGKSLVARKIKPLGKFIIQSSEKHQPTRGGRVKSYKGIGLQLSSGNSARVLKDFIVVSLIDRYKKKGKEHEGKND